MGKTRRKAKPAALVRLSPGSVKNAIIRQDELEAILDDYNSLGLMILDIRRRLDAGATLELGRHTAKSNLKIPISLYEAAGAITRLGMWGLDIEQQLGDKLLRVRNSNSNVVSMVRKNIGSNGTRLEQTTQQPGPGRLGKISTSAVLAIGSSFAPFDPARPGALRRSDSVLEGIYPVKWICYSSGLGTQLVERRSSW